jgi:ABC-type transporter Mla subunit MlaD
MSLGFVMRSDLVKLHEIIEKERTQQLIITTQSIINYIDNRNEEYKQQIDRLQKQVDEQKNLTTDLNMELDKLQETEGKSRLDKLKEILLKIFPALGDIKDYIRNQLTSISLFSKKTAKGEKSKKSKKSKKN